MFFSLGPKESDPQFSYILAKHPDSVFEKDLGGGRKVIGKFGEDGQYAGHVENDPRALLETVRGLNFSNYVHVQLSAVCPHNLKAIDKAQPLYSLIKVPNGWKAMGDIKVGDVVCTPDGKTANVNGVFPQGLRSTYRITFEDSRTTDCCSEHLWKVFKGQREEAQILSLAQMLEWTSNHREALHIPLLEALYAEDKELPIDPYIFGCLLGDGCFSLKGALTLGSANQEIIENISSRLKEGYHIEQNKSNKFIYTIKGENLQGFPGIRKCVNFYKNALDSMGLIEKYSYDKFIPEIYKEASIEQRLELLRGLMDTDGTADLTGCCSFGSTSHQLALDVQYLVRSLGGLAKIGIHEGAFSIQRQKKDRNYYRVGIRHPHTELFFKLARKKERAFKVKKIKNRIKSIKFIGETLCQCIRIDHLDHLYITDNFIVTHNTFNSALRGKFDKSLPGEDFLKPKALKALIGPYPCAFDKLAAVFEELHIKAERSTTLRTKNGETEIFEAFMLHLETIQDMSVTEFLQKIYLISFYFTIRYNLARIEQEQIAKFVIFCKDWLEQSTFRNSIVNTLCRRNKELISKFETCLINDSSISEEEKDEKKAQVATFLTKETLHAKRHDAILPFLAGKSTLIDLCCGEGRFIQKVRKAHPEIQIIGIEANPSKVSKAIQIAGKNSKVRIIHSDVFYPKMEQSQLSPDFLTLIEALEHIPTKEQRDELLVLIRDLFQPTEFVISVPNVDYNVNFGLQPGEYRHPDHAVEYTIAQFQQEVITVLWNDYEVEYVPLELQPIVLEDIKVDYYRLNPQLNEPANAVRLVHLPTSTVVHCCEQKIPMLNYKKAMEKLRLELFPPKDQPSFIIHGKRRTERKPCTKLYRKTQELYHDIYLDTVDFTVNTSEIAAGLTSKQVLINGKNIFYLAPTIAPVEYTPEVPNYLEHPLACYQYFRSRGVTFVASEKKYMGSRGYFLIFKTPEIAKANGFDSPIIVNSRQGYPFFSDQSILNSLYADIQPKMQDEFIMLDAEIMPWSYKAKKLIQYDFRYPGECCYLSRWYGNYGSLENAKKFLEALNVHATERPLEVRMFQLLAKGSGKNVVNGLYLSKIEMYSDLARLEGDIFKSVEYEIVDLSNADAVAKDLTHWLTYCESGGEGFVYKPWNWNSKRLPSGCYIQPALKVRGREYLRIIYGIDYLENESFEILKSRRIRNKRALALQEFELSKRILNAFLHRNRRELLKSVACFIGTEHHANARIDATL